MDLQEVVLQPVVARDEARFRGLMDAHHYLGAPSKIGESLWYVASWRGRWLALLSFAAAALKCAVRDRWIGWDFRHQYGRLHLVTNNTRFLILPEHHHRNLGSRILSLCERRLPGDWLERFGHPLLLLETFVDAARFHGTVYRAANWLALGATRGFQRTREGYTNQPSQPKAVFVRPLHVHARTWLSQPVLEPRHRHGVPKVMLSAEHIRSLPALFAEIDDPRRRQGRRHSLPTVLAIATAATLCGMRGYKAIAQWAADLSPRARERFGCRRRRGRYEVPSQTIIRDVLVRVCPEQLDRALQGWNERYGLGDDAFAIDGKTLCNAIDEDGRQIHVLSAVGHDSRGTYAQKKSAPCREAGMS